MAKKQAVTLAFAAAMLASSAAFAEEPGPYINLGVGASFLEGLSATGVNGRTVTLNENVGGLGISALGYQLPNGLRGEVEFGYRYNSAKNITLPSGGTTPTSLNLKANAAALSYMANGLYDFQPVWGLIPHLGAGVGAANVRISNVGHSWPFAWQAMAGAEYPLRPNIKLGLEYRFLGTESLDLRPTPVTLQSRANYYDHAVLLTFRWGFGAPKPAPQPAAAVVPPPAPPPPPPPPATRDYTVYFDTNSATLSATARQLIRQAAATAQQAGMTHITVTGHTDTTGTTQYNQGLSVRRADAVRAELIAQGVPADAIATSGVGESQLAVPTAQGINEPRNRRVVITTAGPGS